MKQAVLSHFDLPWLPLTGLVIFCVCFSLYAFYTYRKSNKSYYERASLIPLEDARKDV
jgi:cbb3-type cytochrome oxidase subunit 3